MIRHNSSEIEVFGRTKEIEHDKIAWKPGVFTWKPQESRFSYENRNSTAGSFPWGCISYLKINGVYCCFFLNRIKTYKWSANILIQLWSALGQESGFGYGCYGRSTRLENLLKTLSFSMFLRVTCSVARVSIFIIS